MDDCGANKAAEPVGCFKLKTTDWKSFQPRCLFLLDCPRVLSVFCVIGCDTAYHCSHVWMVNGVKAWWLSLLRTKTWTTTTNGGNRQLCHLHLGDHMFLKRLTPSCTCIFMPSCMQHKLFPHLSHLPSAPFNTTDGMKAAFVLSGYYNERKEVRHLQLFPKKKKDLLSLQHGS